MVENIVDTSCDGSEFMDAIQIPQEVDCDLTDPCSQQDLRHDLVHHDMQFLKDSWANITKNEENGMRQMVAEADENNVAFGIIVVYA